MTISKTWFTTLGIALATGVATLSADHITLRSGTSLDGSLVSADGNVVRFRLANGVVAKFPRSEVLALEILPRNAPPRGTPDPARAPAPFIVPPGTVLNVRLTEPIDVDAASAGAIYRSVLDDPIMTDGAIVIPRGARVRLRAVAVKQAGNLKGADKITLKAESLSFGGMSYEIVTTYVQTKGKGEGQRTAKKVGIGAGLGAAFGALFGGGTGAAIGAAVGGTAGAVVANQDTEHLVIPAETRLQFQLNAALIVHP